MTTFMNVTSEPYCVYGHFIEENCIYVGSGYLKRAFEFERDRSERHREALRANDISVKIFNRHRLRADALAQEREMIKTRLPLFNIQNGDTQYRRKKITAENARKHNNETRAKLAREKRDAKHSKSYPIMCIQTGQYFFGAGHAGRVLNKCRSRIRAAVTGACRSVDGYMFVQATWEESGLDKSLVGRQALQDTAPASFKR